MLWSGSQTWRRKIVPADERVSGRDKCRSSTRSEDHLTGSTKRHRPAHTASGIRSSERRRASRSQDMRGGSRKSRPHPRAPAGHGRGGELRARARPRAASAERIVPVNQQQSEPRCGAEPKRRATVGASRQDLAATSQRPDRAPRVSAETTRRSRPSSAMSRRSAETIRAGAAAAGNTRSVMGHNTL
jgi:hypothetical protein